MLKCVSFDGATHSNSQTKQTVVVDQDWDLMVHLPSGLLSQKNTPVE
jgi:hypothetical protein